ncbi:methylase, partial [bacterium]|nr:methylase [bacterium]
YPFEVHEREEKYEAINLITDEINVGKPQQKKTENHYDYIMGNPPFVGYSYQSKEQKNDIFATCCNKNGVFYKGVGKIDYVAGWYFKTAGIIQGTDTKAAFVSTNSITQGEQVAALWKPLFSDYNIKIDFAWRTFKWANETSDKKNMAAVHCVIIGFSCHTDSISLTQNQDKNKYDNKKIFNADGTVVEAKNINGYLLDAPNIWVESRAKSLCDVPQMTTGNRPTDGGNLIIENDDYETFIKKEPNAKKYIKKLLGSEEFINNKIRWCLWLVNATPAEIKRMPEVYKRVQQCKAAREASPDVGRRKLAETPALFREINNPETFLLVPKVSSERRLYIPIGFFDSEIISTDLNFIVSDATLYHFGVLTSSVHNAWMRAVCGRLESRYRYSKDIVYNNFPWCNPTDAQKAKIEQTAQAILDTRAKYPDSSLADLYDETTMPPDLRKAHRENDKAVMVAYGFNPKMSESEIIAELFKMYEKLIKKK